MKRHHFPKRNIRKTNTFKINTSRKEKRRFIKKQNKIKQIEINQTHRSVKKTNKKIIKEIKSLKSVKSRIPWLTELSLNSSGLLKLHYEIIDFYTYIKPKNEENAKRQETVNKLISYIKNRFPTYEVKIFGSFSVDLHLSDSDIDIVIFDHNSLNFSTDNLSQYEKFQDEYKFLEIIYDHLYNYDSVEDIRFVDAKVPIIKVKTNNNIEFDISYNNIKIG